MHAVSFHGCFVDNVADHSSLKNLLYYFVINQIFEIPWGHILPRIEKKTRSSAIAGVPCDALC